MDLAVNELKLYYNDFEAEFTYFFKDLMNFTENQRRKL